MTEKYRFMVGSYAAHDKDGIYAYEMEVNEESVRLRKLYAVSGSANPSFLLMHPSGRVLYAVEELSPEGRIAVYTMEKGGPQLLMSLPSEGADPCHLSLSADAGFLTAANYTDGSLSMFRLDEHGIPLCMTEHRRHEGHGVYKGRQESPHVHFSKYVNGRLYVCDLGLDRVFCYQPDAETGQLKETDQSLQLPDGCGPRHLAVNPAHPELLYVITEMSAEIFVFCIPKEKGAADAEHSAACESRFLQRISILPDGEDAASVSLGMIGAAVRFSEDGHFLLASARVFNQIAVFAVEADGMLRMMAISDCGVQMPRDFDIFGRNVIVAGQESGNIRALKLDPVSGKLTDIGAMQEVPKASCILKI
ncbi:MAG: lactonase family protein [Butyrivibrio sp.]|nr:lactonase family protein [Butyrivibrio sp.]